MHFFLGALRVKYFSLFSAHSSFAGQSRLLYSTLIVFLLLMCVCVRVLMDHSHEGAMGWSVICDCGNNYSRPLIAQDKLFHRQNAVRNFLNPST